MTRKSRTLGGVRLLEREVGRLGFVFDNVGPLGVEGFAFGFVEALVGVGGGDGRRTIDRKVMVSYKGHMSVLTIRISDEEDTLLAKRAKEAGGSTGALVRVLIKAEPTVTSGDLLKEMKSPVGEENLRIRVR